MRTVQRGRVSSSQVPVTVFKFLDVHLFVLHNDKVTRFDLGPIWFGADLTWGRFDLLPTTKSMILQFKFTVTCNISYNNVDIIPGSCTMFN